jgi:hypothetical protein
MSGLFMRALGPLAMMISASQVSHQRHALEAPVGVRNVLVCGSPGVHHLTSHWPTSRPFLSSSHQLARFVADNEEALRRIEPEPTLAVANDRAKDMWDPLLAIADIAGGGWRERAHTAGKALVEVGEEQAAGANVDVQLLADIRDIFAACMHWRSGRGAPGAERGGP